MRLVSFRKHDDNILSQRVTHLQKLSPEVFYLVRRNPKICKRIYPRLRLPNLQNSDGLTLHAGRGQNWARQAQRQAEALGIGE